MPPAAPVAAPSPTPEAAAAPAAELTLESLQARWEDVLQTLRRDFARSSVPALLEHARVSAVRGDELLLDASSPFFRSSLDSGEARTTLEQALQGVFGRALRVRVRLQPAEGGEDPQIDQDDPLVAGAMALGARVSIRRDEAEGD